MNRAFNFLLNLNFLQKCSSYLVSSINPSVLHNIDKYIAIKKVHYLSSIEDIQGDYLEFGVFSGSSFCHSIRCYKKLEKINKSSDSNTKFFGFDSFEGFGKTDRMDQHPFYIDSNFQVDYKKVERKVKKVSNDVSFKLIKGFFSDTLKNGPKSFNINKSKIIFIDCDTFSSASEALIFCSSIIQNGTYIILDDFFSYKGSEFHGVSKAFNNLIEKNNFDVRLVFTYGMGGVVYIVSNTNKDNSKILDIS